MQELHDLKDALLAAGWRIERNPFADELNKADWYAWQKSRPATWVNCECNDKPPALTIWPSYARLPDGGEVSGAEFELCGELHGRWFKLRSYPYRTDEIVGAIEQATRHLGAAWNAIAKEG